MIDPHVHLRDWNEASKETVKHGLSVAYRAGLDGVFEMPNTDPALTSIKTIKDRIDLADQVIKELGIKIFHSLYAGLTNDPEQIKEVVCAYHKFFPRVVGLKMFAGHSTSNMGIIEQQQLVYKTLAKLGYQGVLAVHCEKESLLKPELWNPSKPFTHTLARPPEAEIMSVRDQITFASDAGYKGTLHIPHISVPGALEHIEQVRGSVDFTITCGLTPHHGILYDEMMNSENGLQLKINPPLRPRHMQEYLFNALLKGRISWVETDHAPHTLNDKMKEYASGIPGFPFYPVFIKRLIQAGASTSLIDAITHKHIMEIFGLKPDLIPNTRRAIQISQQELDALADEYEFDAFEGVRNI